MILAGIGAGFQAAHKLSEQTERWRVWKELLGRLYDRLAFTGLPLQTLFLECADDPAFQSMPWLQMFHDPHIPLKCPQSAITAEEQEFTQALFEGLGVSGLQDQLRWLEEFKRRASILEEEAASKKRERARIYMAFGVCSGLCLAVLLL
ncbi:MAG: stage III sporulation protein AB [Clostridia bacterium]|nr:stage III sporulation protein AB [Clostridia bacterium]